MVSHDLYWHGVINNIASYELRLPHWSRWNGMISNVYQHQSSTSQKYPHNTLHRCSRHLIYAKDIDHNLKTIAICTTYACNEYWATYGGTNRAETGLGREYHGRTIQTEYVYYTLAHFGTLWQIGVECFCWYDKWEVHYHVIWEWLESRSWKRPYTMSNRT
jgi:hypothetical protein